MDGGYDIGYRFCSCFWGRDPGSLVKLLAMKLPSFEHLSVLDVGCGEGKNAAFFGARGAQVRALDISEYAIANAQAEWSQIDTITWECVDIRYVDLPELVYDVVIAYGLLHCLNDKGEIEHTVQKIQKATKVGGYNIVCAFNSRFQDLRAHPGFIPCLVDHEFYLEQYSGWDLITASDSDLIETHPHNNIQHTHSMTRLIARKD